MKRMSKAEIDRQASQMAINYVCRFGLRNADGISKKLRGLIINEVKRRKKNG